jgi:hypothetical protein
VNSQIILAPPAGANGVDKGIAATTPLLLFEPGKHLLAVTAQMSKGNDSDPNKCTIGAEISLVKRRLRFGNLLRRRALTEPVRLL